MSPRHYSKNIPPVKLFIPTRIRDYYLTLQQGETEMTEKTNANTVFVQVVDRPKRKLILKRSKKAGDYFAYCEEFGCDEPWNTLTSIKDALYEPIGMWLPENLRKPGTGIYAQGVEMAADYKGEVPEGYDIIDLPSCKMMIFQGQPFEDEKFGDAISEIWEVMKKYNPEIYGFTWSDEDAPRFQLEPQGYRGYIEGRPVREVNKS